MTKNKKGLSALTHNMKTLGWKEFMRRWKEGAMKIPPEDLLFSELIGYAGTILATIVGVIIFCFTKGMWPWALLMGFTGWIQASAALGKWQQWQTLKALKSSIVDINEIFKQDIKEKIKKKMKIKGGDSDE